MPINADHEFIQAEKKYLEAGSLEEKILCLEDLIRKAPSHKGAENLRAELKTRLKKLKEKLEKGKKSGKGGKKGIRKEGFQCVLVGKTNSGKSCLLGKLTNASSRVSGNLYTTKEPIVGSMDYGGVKVQIVDLPAIDGKEFNSNLTHTADCLLVVVENVESIAFMKEKIEKFSGKKIFVYNKMDLVSDKRKLEARLKSMRLNFVGVSCVSGEGLESLKEKIFYSMDVIRIFTKEPGKEKSKEPVVLPEGSSVKDVAETIYKGFSSKVKETRLTGPSGKFANQKVGLGHRLKDMDVVEFRS